MYVLGHVVTAIRSGLFRGVDLPSGERVLELMLPDLLSCHDWAYGSCWERADSTRDRLVTAHMIGDAVVHYGRTWTGQRHKKGWAYVRMGQVARRYDEFWQTAAEQGWRKPEAGEPDSRRGWAHTLVEYSIDQYLADTSDWSMLLASAREQARSTIMDTSWVHEYLTASGSTPSKPVAAQPQRYCGAIERATEPDEIHLRGLAVKFELFESPEIIQWLRGWTRHIIRGVGNEEIQDVIQEMTQVIAEPARHGYPTTLRAAAKIPDPLAAWDPLL